jgi:transmembrane sensor
MAARFGWEELRDHLRPDWTPERAARIESAVVKERRRSRRRDRLALVGGVVVVLVVFAVVVGDRYRERQDHLAKGERLPIAVSEGPEVIALTSATRLRELHPSEGRHGYRLLAGAARFTVPRGWARPFRVVAGEVTVDHLGTVFTIEMLAQGRVSVGVEEGRVRLQYPGGLHELAAHERWEYPAPSSIAAEPSPPARRSSAKPRTPPAHTTWKRLAEAGAFDEAYSAMSSDSRSVADSPGDLLLAADAARLSGHPEQAARYLRQVVDGHPEDPRASLAAFSLGRVLLDELGRPGDAAAAFAQAMGARDLAEDALARQVEALARAGDRSGARGLAEQYVEKYPKGRRLRAVKRYGELQ